MEAAKLGDPFLNRGGRHVHVVYVKSWEAIVKLL